VETAASSLTLPRLPRSPERLPSQAIRGVSPSCNRNRRAAEFRQRSPSPHYQPRVNPSEVTSPRERFQDAKEMFRAMEREAIGRPILSRQRDIEHHPVHRCFEDAAFIRVVNLKRYRYTIQKRIYNFFQYFNKYSRQLSSAAPAKIMIDAMRKFICYLKRNSYSARDRVLIYETFAGQH